MSAVQCETISSVKARAKARLIELLHQVSRGEHVAPSNVTLRAYMERWLVNPAGINAKTAERYRQLAAQQSFPHLGEIDLQTLSEDHLQTWHGVLLAWWEGRPAA